MTVYTDTLQAVADNPHIWAKDDRAAVFQACDIALAQDGYIHPSNVRPILARIREVEPHRIGANFNAYRREHNLTAGPPLPNGDTKSGNKNKLSHTWRLS